MDPNDTPESKTHAPNTSSNKNRTGQVHGSIKKIEPSHLKKNEFALILFGALLLTGIIFFLFFRSSDTITETVDTKTSNSSSADLEKRVEALENALEILEKAGRVADGSGTDEASGIGHVKERVTSLETAFSVKFSSLLKRMDDIEKSISESKKKSVAIATSQPAAPVKKKKETRLSHTIKKGETLYSISKKYNTTVTSIRKLNKMTDDAKIYPGGTIIVK